MGEENFPVGFVLCIIAGFCNGSWQLPLKDDCPAGLQILDPENGGWKWENAWFVFTISTIVLSIAYVFGVLGFENINEIMGEVPAGDVALVVIFCLMWGAGGFGFGQAVKYLGMAIGTSLCMGVVLVWGTLLPLLVNNLDEAASYQFALTILGAGIGILAFALSAYAGSFNEAEQELDQGREQGSEMMLSGRKVEKEVPGDETDAVIAMAALEEEEKEKEGKEHADAKISISTGSSSSCTHNYHPLSAANGSLSHTAGKENETETATAAAEAAVVTTTTTPPPPTTTTTTAGQMSENPPQSPEIFMNRQQIGVIIAIVGGTLSSFLQFAFVFGQSIVDATEEDERNIPDVFSAYIIWLFAFTLQGATNLIYTSYLLTNQGLWGRYSLRNGAESRMGMSGKGTEVRGERGGDVELRFQKLGSSSKIPDEYPTAQQEQRYCTAASYINSNNNDNNDNNSQLHGKKQQNSPISTADILEFTRKICICACMGVTWMAHIYIYGYSQSLMGDLGAGIAWPLIMISTVATGQFWSFVLGEWHAFTNLAYFWNLISLGVMVAAVLVIALGNSV